MRKKSLDYMVEGCLLLITITLQYLVATSISTKKYTLFYFFKSALTVSLKDVARGSTTTGRECGLLYLRHVSHD